MHQAAIKAMIKEIEADKDVSNTKVTKKTKSKKEILIPESTATLKAKTSNAKAADVTKKQKLQKFIQLDENSTKSKTTHQQQAKVKATEKTKKLKSETKKTPISKVKNVQVQPIKNLSQDLITKNISKEIESKHQMLKELKRRVC